VLLFFCVVSPSEVELGEKGTGWCEAGRESTEKTANRLIILSKLSHKSGIMERAVAVRQQQSSQVRGNQQEVGARMPPQNQRVVHNQQHHHHLHTSQPPPPVTYHPNLHHLLLHSSHNPLTLLQKSSDPLSLSHSSLSSRTPPSRRIPRWLGCSPLSCPTHSLSFTTTQPGSSAPEHFAHFALSNYCTPVVPAVTSPVPQTLSMATHGIISTDELARMQELSNNWEPEATVCKTINNTQLPLS
jgi:hypothetical protein